MFRRDFLSAAAGSAASVQKPSGQKTFEDLIRSIEMNVSRHLVNVKSVQVHYDPTHPELPLMVLVFRG